MIAVMIAGIVAGVVSLITTRALISAFRVRGLGQPILGKEDLGPEHHMSKQGTPTMGGIAILVAAFIGWVVAHVRRGLPFSDQAAIVWVGILAMALMGFLDDYIKVRKRHNRGIFWKQKNYITMLHQLRHRVVAGRRDRDRRDDLADPGRPPRLAAADRGVDPLCRVDHLGHDERRQRDRRTRRVGRRLGADGVRGVHDHRVLVVPEPGHLRRRRQPARHDRPRRRVRRGLHGLPLVQRRAGARSSWATSARWASARRWRCSR